MAHRGPRFWIRSETSSWASSRSRFAHARTRPPRAVAPSADGALSRHEPEPAETGKEGKFHEDLWFRVNAVRITIPPLRERRADVPLLARFFVNKYNQRYNRDVKLTESGVKAMQEQPWPGNVRQLQHMIERLTILAPNDHIDGEAVDDALDAMESHGHPAETLADTEAEQIRRAGATGGNKSRAAQPGIERKTLYRKLSEREGPPFT